MNATEQQTYNGWTNYATWGVALVLDNDRGTYEHVREQAATFQATSEHPALDLADFLKDFTEDLCGLEGWRVYSDDEISLGGGTGVEVELSLMARQVLQAGLAEVNWREIAENTLSET